MNSDRFPHHIAIIMDGNGRWAKSRGLDRSSGHIAGVKTVRNIVDVAPRIGVKCLTLYAFSTENWLRPTEEVDNLMKLFADSLVRYGAELHEKGVRLVAIGDIDRLPSDSLKKLNELTQLTADNNMLTLVIALSYSSRVEIGRALVRYLSDTHNRTNLDQIDPYNYPLDQYLDTAGLPELDLLIRTGGEQRLSNFLLYQAAYAELYFTDTLWPDFDEVALRQAIEEFARRERRYGKVLDNQI